jgi:hypothetical protein
MSKKDSHRFITDVNAIDTFTKYVVIGRGRRGNPDYCEGDQVTHFVHGFAHVDFLNLHLDNECQNDALEGEALVFELVPVEPKKVEVKRTTRVVK